MNARARSRAWMVLAIAGCAAVVVFYVLPYVSHLELPAGDDSTFYVGAIRDVGKLGLLDPQVAARPAYPLLGAMLGSVSGTSPWIVTTALPIALVVALGLAGVAVALRWRGAGAWGAAFVVLAALSAVAARLVAGKAENLMILALICALLALFAWADGPRRWAGIGGVALAAGLTEWPLMLVFLGILAIDAVVLAVRRDRAGLAAVVSLGVGSAAGFVVALLAVLIASHASLRIENLPGPARYGTRLDVELQLLWVPVAVGLCVLGWWTARRLRRAEVEPLSRVLTVWLVATGAALAVGLLGAPFPSYRMLTFGLPLVLASAAAAFFVAGWKVAGSAWRVARPILGVAIAVVSVLPAVNLWFRGLPPAITAAQVRELQTAARYAATLPDGDPAVVVVRLKPTKFLVYQRIVHDVLPLESDNPLMVFIGRVRDAEAGHPSRAFTKRGQDLIDRLFEPIGRALRNGAPILTGRALAAAAFETAVKDGAPVLEDQVALVRGSPPPGALPGESLPIPVRPLAVASFAGLALAIAFAAGIGWGLLLVPRASLAVQMALAPALGFGSAGVVAFAAMRAGVSPSGTAAAVELVVVLLLSAGAGVAGRLIPDRASPEARAQPLPDR